MVLKSPNSKKIKYELAISQKMDISKLKLYENLFIYIWHIESQKMKSAFFRNGESIRFELKCLKKYLIKP
jgi:hypothetical protein